MLILSRKLHESILIGQMDNQTELITVTVISITDGRIKLGIDAPHHIQVFRHELWERIQREQQLLP